MTVLINKIKELSEKQFEQARADRRHIHQNPELSFHEQNTSAYVFNTLKSIGLEPYHMADTGVIAIIKGKNPEAKTIALRAELDALPILEKNSTGYISKNPGIMHACGHDVHSASLLGAARILHELRDEFEGSIKLIFQPGEEKLPGGASLLIKEGVLKNPSPARILAQHVMPELEAGKVGFRPGIYMASTDEIYITVKGKGGHGAMPHQNIDPVLIASHLIVAMQQLVSRWSRPAMPSVLSFGKVTADGATNVIPDEVKLEGTFRTFDEEWRTQAHEKINHLAKGLCESMGGEAEVDIRRGYPYLQNDDELTKNMHGAAEEYMGAENVVHLDLRTTAEDFAFFSHHLPSCFYRLGVRNEQMGITAPVHSPHFDIDESALKTGMGLMAYLAVKSLED